MTKENLGLISEKLKDAGVEILNRTNNKPVKNEDHDWSTVFCRIRKDKEIAGGSVFEFSLISPLGVHFVFEAKANTQEQLFYALYYVHLENKTEDPEFALRNHGFSAGQIVTELSREEREAKLLLRDICLVLREDN